MLSPRHGSSGSGDGVIQYHWGYFTRELPCTSDAGNCAYLDAVYGGHDLSMIYSAILWAVIGGVLLFCAVVNYFPVSRRVTGAGTKEVEQPNERQGTVYRVWRSIVAVSNRYLLSESLTPVFGHTTRLNILVLVILIGYLTIFTFVGITYKTWYSPIEGTNLKMTRAGLGPWADRIGVMAYALTPLSLLLSSRESLLSLITGIPYHHFNFLHRWLGWIIYIQSALHTIGWTIFEGHLYQPQPQKWNEFISQQYIISGIVAMICITFLVLHSTQWCIRLTGYEFFRKSHYVIAMVYVGTCWGHWDKLRCWMIASLIVWMLDRTVRLVRAFIVHCAGSAGSNYSLCGSVLVPKAKMTSFPNGQDGDVVRLDFQHDYPTWNIGQHFYLCFPELSVWQSHPMTPSSVPVSNPQGQGQSHSYIIRAKKGLTKDLAGIARETQTESGSSLDRARTTEVLLSGPYGQSIVDADLIQTDDINLFCVAGGTGITFILPVLMSLATSNKYCCRKGLTEFVWVIRRKADMKWISTELDTLRETAEIFPSLRIRIFVTREELSAESDGTSSGPTDSNPIDKGFSDKTVESSCCGQPSPNEDDQPFMVQHIKDSDTAHPNIAPILGNFVSRTVAGPTRVMASGPPGMISDLRKAVALSNDPGRVLKGDERCDVQLVHDDRVEW